MKSHPLLVNLDNNNNTTTKNPSEKHKKENPNRLYLDACEKIYSTTSKSMNKNNNNNEDDNNNDDDCYHYLSNTNIDYYAEENCISPKHNQNNNNSNRCKQTVDVANIQSKLHRANKVFYNGYLNKKDKNKDNLQAEYRRLRDQSAEGDSSSAARQGCGGVEPLLRH